MVGSTTKYLPVDDGDENQAEVNALPLPAAPQGAVPLPPSLSLRDEGSGHETETEDSGSDNDTRAKRDPNYISLQLHDKPFAKAAAVKSKPKKSKLFKGKKDNKSDDVTYVQISGAKPKHHSAPVQQGDGITILSIFTNFIIVETSLVNIVVQWDLCNGQLWGTRFRPLLGSYVCIYTIGT